MEGNFHGFGRSASQNRFFEGYFYDGSFRGRNLRWFPNPKDIVNLIEEKKSDKKVGSPKFPGAPIKSYSNI